MHYRKIKKQYVAYLTITVSTNLKHLGNSHENLIQDNKFMEYFVFPKFRPKEIERLRVPQDKAYMSRPMGKKQCDEV